MLPDDEIVREIRYALADHPAKAIAAFVATVLFALLLFPFMWVVVPALENVLEWAGVPR